MMRTYVRRGSGINYSTAAAGEFLRRYQLWPRRFDRSVFLFNK